MNRSNLGSYTVLPRVRTIQITRVANRLLVKPFISMARPGDIIRLENRTNVQIYGQIYGLTPVFAIRPRSAYSFAVPRRRSGVYPIALYAPKLGLFGWGPIPCTSSQPIIIVPKL